MQSSNKMHTGVMIGGVAMLFALSACQLPPIEVEAIGAASAPLIGPFHLTTGSDPVTAPLLQQRGLLAESAALRLTVAQAVRAASVGVCMAGTTGCPFKPPHRWFTANPPTRYTLTLSFTDAATGALVYRVEASVRAKTATSPQRAEQLLNAALDCTGCAAGRKIVSR